MFMRNWLKDVFQAEAGDDSSSGLSLTDHGDDRTLTAPTTETVVDATSGDSETAADEPEGDGEKAKADDESQEPSADDIGDDLLERAVALGLEYEDIKQFRTDHTLRKELDRVERFQQRYDSRKPASEQKAEADETPAAPDFDAILKKQSDGLAATRAKIKSMRADGYDEAQMELMEERLAAEESQWEVLKWQNERSRQLEEINSQLLEFANGQQQQAQAEAVAKAESEFEKAIGELGDEYKELFGEGPGTKLEPSSKQFRNRQALWAAASEFADLAAKRGQQASVAVLVKKAVAAEFSDKTNQIARAKLKQDMKRAGSQSVTRARPAGPSKGLTGEAAALAATAAFLAEAGS